jgi:hypothetical protein
VIPAVRGLSDARGVIHLHSVYSHDACDGNGLPGGQPNAPCLADLRAAICTDHLDFAMLTDHPAHFAEHEFPEDLLIAPGDAPVMKDGAPVANLAACAQGPSEKVLLMAGHEGNNLSPLGLTRHVDGDIAARQAFYGRFDLDQANTYKTLGAVDWIFHTEGMTDDELRSVAPALSGLEVYQLHANLAANIREQSLHVDPAAATVALAAYAQVKNAEPDLVFLAFFEENLPSLAKWGTLTSEGYHVAASAGCDAHENAFPLKLSDGERGDSYRRMIRWTPTHALVDGPLTPDSVKAALTAGRTYVALEAYGTPIGFDFHASQAPDPPAPTTVEMGGTAQVGALLEVAAPTVYGVEPAKQPAMTLRLLRAREGGWDEVAKSTVAIHYLTTQAGAYRAEVDFTPSHLAPYLGANPAKYLKQVPWIYASPVYVQ